MPDASHLAAAAAGIVLGSAVREAAEPVITLVGGTAALGSALTCVREYASEDPRWDRAVGQARFGARLAALCSSCSTPPHEIDYLHVAICHHINPLRLACAGAVTAFDRLADPSRGVYYTAYVLTAAIGYVIVDSYVRRHQR